MSHLNVTSTSTDEYKVLAKALGRLKVAWGLTGHDLALIVGVDPAVISRLDVTKAFHPDKKSGQLALMLIRVYRSLGAFLGDRLTLQQKWLRADHTVFNCTPIEAMKTPEGLARVVMYLDAMRGAEA